MKNATGWAVCVAASLLGVGCAKEAIRPPQFMAGPSVSSDAFDPGLAAPPVRVGDVFVYDNPVERLEVVAIGDHFIDYRDGQGGYSKGTWSAVLPKLRWASTYSAGNRTLTRVEGTLHPLAKGNRIVFREDTMGARPGIAFYGTWECVVQDQVQVTVKAGTAQTWQILCSVDGRERSLLNYSDELGGLVRMAYVMDDGSTIIRQLTGYGRRQQPAAAESAADAPAKQL